ncbi:hypothetical protein [Streptomyces sp. NBC_01643]|uniref:hypothetical protein n=1 Tax=Streptomyces sp. NBC_01643 TaxID=2975906 RepID=UPI002F9067D7|nr:hypothetical protein OHB03_46710 [Streptomyces sp. NBC_01643]
MIEVPGVLVAPSRVMLLRLLSDASTELDEVLTLLGACGVPGCADLPIGVIDRLLLVAHRAVTGRDLELVVSCPACGALSELPLGASDVPSHTPRCSWCGPGAGVREPVGADLLGLPVDGAEAARELLRRCSVGPAEGGRDQAALDRAEQSLCGNVRVACTSCRGPIEHYVDVQHLVATAVASAVADVDVEVHLIASRYKWDLSTIELLPEKRRARLAALAAGVPG